MKKIITVVALLVSISAFASDFSFMPKVGGGISYLTKIEQIPNLQDVRKINTFFDVETVLTHKTGWGAGAEFVFVPANVTLFNVLKGSADFYGWSLGPVYTHTFGKLNVYGSGKVGLYRTTATFDIGGVAIALSQNSIGFNTGVGMDYNLYKSLFAGFKTAYHYIANTGDNDDANIFTFGPVVSWQF